jgi:hypothetical protein
MEERLIGLGNKGADGLHARGYPGAGLKQHPYN